MLGNWKASRKASDAVPGPRTRARIMSRAKPAMRLTMVRPPIVPVALIRLIAPRARPGSGSGLADDFRGLAAGRFRLELGRALHVKRSEIDQIGRASCRESVSVRVDLGGRRIIKKKNTKT